MSKRERDKSNKNVAKRQEQARKAFPEDSFESTSSSGNESNTSSVVRRRKSKIKSGAKIVHRPVVRTELWPHTIANEDDAEKVTSEDIGLLKFLACYTKISLGCSRYEAKGRCELLHAITTVLEALRWSDARDFHNIIMLKIEQERLEWDANFLDRASAFIDKKIRNG